jgi:hypothetical protein
MEVWKNINCYYRVSNLGNVESCKMGYWRSMNKTKMPKGYLCVNLSENNKAKKQYVHRLVAIYFLSNPLCKKTVNHKNGIKDDNRVENLEWATQSENNKHSYDIGIKKPTNQLGNKNGNARLTDLQVNEIRNLWNKGNITKLKLASIFSVSDAHICRIINKKQRIDIL